MADFAALRESIATIPPEDASIEAQARRTLQLLLESPSDSSTLTPIAPGECPNCGTTVVARRTPYCSDRCRDVAALVRQFRAGVEDASILDPARQVAFGQNLWFLLGGGHPLRNTLIKPKELARALAKGDNRCDACGEPATTVDHRGSFCNRTSNLRPMCDACVTTREFGDLRVLERREVRQLIEELRSRIHAPSALRPCDDAESWDWRAFLRAQP